MKGAIKIITHVWGANYGNPNANCAATVYVGNGSDVTQFRDPRKDDEKEQRGKKKRERDWDTNYLIDNKCDGQNGFLLKRMIQTGMVDLQGWEHFVRSMRAANLPIRQFVRAATRAIEKAIAQAVTRYRKGSPAIGHLGLSCIRGRHRSVGCATMINSFLSLQGFGTGLRLHHCRVIPGIDDRGECGCMDNACKLAFNGGWEKDTDWNQKQRAAREHALSVVVPMFEAEIVPHTNNPLLEYWDDPSHGGDSTNPGTGTSEVKKRWEIKVLLKERSLMSLHQARGPVTVALAVPLA